MRRGCPRGKVYIKEWKGEIMIYSYACGVCGWKSYIDDFINSHCCKCYNPDSTSNHDINCIYRKEEQMKITYKGKIVEFDLQKADQIQIDNIKHALNEEKDAAWNYIREINGKLDAITNFLATIKGEGLK